MSIKSRFKDEYWLHSAFFTLLKTGSSLVLALGSFYFLVRILDKNTFGVWSLFLGTTTLLEFARNGLVSNAFLKFLSAAEESDYPKIVTASVSVTAILTLLGIIVNCSIAHWLSVLWKAPEVVPLFYAYNFVFIITGCINQLTVIQQANLQFKGSFQSALVGSVFNFGYILAAHFLHFPVSLLTLLWVQLAGAVLGLGVAWRYTRSYVRMAHRPERQWVLTLLSFGKFSFGTILSAMIFNSIDQWMLGALLAPAAAAAYNIAVRITNIVEVPTGTMAAIVFPQSARRAALGGDEAAKYLYEKSVGAILAVLLPGLALLYIFAPLVVRVLAGGKYPESLPILRVTIIFCLFIPFSRQFGTILDSTGKPKLNFIIVLLSAAVNVGLNYVFIHRFGIIGAAYGTLCASIFNFSIGQLLLRQLLHVNVFAPFKYAWTFYPDMARRYLRPASDLPANVKAGDV